MTPPPPPPRFQTSSPRHGQSVYLIRRLTGTHKCAYSRRATQDANMNTVDVLRRLTHISSYAFGNSAYVTAAMPVRSLPFPTQSVTAFCHEMF